jgi:alkanesulfonate monooxygenase SsuD/methylene tetrahydromethanopterin reductase-like flavin-dependent oxidoreductase (luciferase family)
MIRGNMALYIGGMGARGKNFYNDYAKRLGFEDAAVKIQDLFLAGRKDEAMAAVPKELIDACHLVGSKDRIKDRLSRWKDAGKRGEVGSMLIGAGQKEALELVAEAML